MKRHLPLDDLDHFLAGAMAMTTSLNVIRGDWFFVAIGLAVLGCYVALAVVRDRRQA